MSAAGAQVITPFSMYFNARLIFQKYEVWRLFTNFLFFGSLGARAARAGTRCYCPGRPAAA